MRRELGRRVARHEPPRGVPDPLHPARGVRERLGREDQGLAVVALGEQHQHGVAPGLVEHLGQAADVADGLGHLAAHLEHPVVHPDPGQRPAAGGQRLRRLVLVVREDQVVAAAVDLERRAELRLGHRGALDVPARPPVAPRRRPARVLHRLGRLPEREVERVLLEPGALEALALVHLVDVAVRELPVLGQRAHAEVDVALRHVGVAAVEQVLDVGDDLLDGLRGPRLAVGPADAQPIGVGEVARRHLLRQVGRRAAERPGGVVDLVVDVGDVGHERRLVALVGEEAGEQAEDDEGTRVADVDRRVHRRAAGVDADPAAVLRAQLGQRSRAGVVQADRAHQPSTFVASCGAPTGLDSGEPRWRR